jgi:hypothetical protein
MALGLAEFVFLMLIDEVRGQIHVSFHLTLIQPIYCLLSSKIFKAIFTTFAISFTSLIFA